jgi:hypothetical protein
MFILNHECALPFDNGAVMCFPFCESSCPLIAVSKECEGVLSGSRMDWGFCLKVDELPTNDQKNYYAFHIFNVFSFFLKR